MHPAAGAVQGWLRGARLLRRNVQRLQVLEGCSGVLRPGRLTLLLGPPASGKTSLLKALAGKLDSSSLEVGMSKAWTHPLNPLRVFTTVRTVADPLAQSGESPWCSQ